MVEGLNGYQIEGFPLRRRCSDVGWRKEHSDDVLCSWKKWKAHQPFFFLKSVQPKKLKGVTTSERKSVHICIIELQHEAMEEAPSAYEMHRGETCLLCLRTLRHRNANVPSYLRQLQSIQQCVGRRYFVQRESDNARGGEFFCGRPRSRGWRGVGLG